MTKAKRRRLALITVLCQLSKEGWRNARYEDYAPIEAELKTLEDER